MEREIKFRAWDGKRFYHFNLIDLFNEGVETDGINNDSKHLGINTQFPYINMPIMQFTGLLDKNKKEIYEGDIVRGGNEMNEGGCISFIEYSHHTFWVHDESFGWEGELLWEWDKLEVIGNIYESPSLLQIKEGSIKT